MAAASSPLVLVANGLQVADGTDLALDVEGMTTVALWLEVIAASGTTPTLDVTIEHSRDGIAWSVLGVFPTVTGVADVPQRFPGVRRYVRARWALGGTSPAFTFAVTGEALQIYATPDDLRALAIPAAALATSPPITDDAIDKALEAGTDEIASALKTGGYALPLTVWGSDIRRLNVNLAAYDVMTVRGYNPDPNGGPDPWRVRYEDALKMLERIRTGDESLAGIPPPDVPATDTGGGPWAWSLQPRGL